MTSYENVASFRRLVVDEVGGAKGIKIKLIILLYRICSYGKFRGGWVSLATFPLYVLYRLYSEFLLGTELPVTVFAGPGLKVFHGQGLIVHTDTKIGARCTLRQGVTIGNKINKDGTLSGAPIIGDDVEIGAGAVLIGDITIGSRVSIGACTVVTKDVPDDFTVVGMGTRMIPKKSRES